MVTGVGNSPYGLQPPAPATGGGSVAALSGRIRQDQVQLNDWTSCVSAKTPKGQAEIRKLAGEISADKQRISRALQAQSNAASASAAASSASVAPTYDVQARVGQQSDTAGAGRSGAIDVWA
jgi:hypothetical protein